MAESSDSDNRSLTNPVIRIPNHWIPDSTDSMQQIGAKTLAYKGIGSDISASGVDARPT